MTDFSGLDARIALVTFFGANVADHPDLGPIISKSDWLASVIDGMEYLYAHRGEINEDGLGLLDGLARFVGAHGFYGKGERAAVISGVATRIAGGGAAVLEVDPAIEPDFAPPADEPEGDAP